MRSAVRRGGLAVGVGGALAFLVLIANASLGDSDAQGETDGPVISLGEDWNAYPDAQVTGRITVVDDCMLLGRSIVFWPYRTAWDEARHVVEFGGDFEASAPAPLGEKFTGGGGFYSPDNVSGIEAVDAKAVLRCIRETGADGAVFAYPDD